jgi:hypothetical protein
MWPSDLAAVTEKSATREGALEVLAAIEQRLTRPPAAVSRLHALLDEWRSPVAIDDAVREAIEAVDPVVEISGTTVRALLLAMRVATTERAAPLRRTRSTQRRKSYKPAG